MHNLVKIANKVIALDLVAYALVDEDGWYTITLREGGSVVFMPALAEKAEADLLAAIAAKADNESAA